MTEIQQVIQDALQRYRGIRRKRAWLAFFGTLVLIMVLAALLDRIWMFSAAARWSGWIAGLAVAAWVARRAAGPGCPDASSLAHRVESDAGEAAPVVATAIDPEVRRSAGHEELAQLLLERVDLRAAEAIRHAPPTFRGQLRMPAVLAAAGVAALVALLALQGGQGLRRMILPWSAAPYTSLSLQGPEGDVAEGRAFTLTARVSGVPVETVKLYQQGSTTPLAEAAPDAQGLVHLTVNGLDGPADFVARGGDGQSDPLRVEPYLLPDIEAFEIEITPPDYAAHAADTETDPSFSTLRGSQLRYRIRLRAPGVTVALERSASPRKEELVTPEERANMERGPYGMPVGPEETVEAQSELPVFRADPADPRVWVTDWALPDPEDIVYRIAIKGTHGDRVRNDEPWRINVLEDAPPEVRIQSHNGGEVIRIGNESVNFDLSAVDDVRLAGARLVFRKPGKPHTRREIVLPADTRRTWSAAELLDLAPLGLGPFDIIAVHAEAEDTNSLDGPGVGRSDVVYLEVPQPESDDEGGGGGGGGGGPQPINPLELQMEILRSTVSFPHDGPDDDRQALAHDQGQNAEYTGTMEDAAFAEGAVEFATLLNKARVKMESASGLLDAQPPVQAIPDEEAALGFLIEAAKLMEDLPGGEPPSGGGEGAQQFTLRPPKGKSSSPQEGDEAPDDGQEELRNLMEDVRRQLAEQEALNEAAGQNGERAGQQQSLAGAARSSAGQARGIPGSANRRGDPRAAAEELERAAGLQDDNAEALAGGDGEASAKLGDQSADALAEALRELAAQLETETYDSESATPGYERLISDYLRSISYE